MLQDVTDWFKAEILGDQSLQQERKKQKSQKDFEKRINEAARHVCPQIVLMNGGEGYLDKNGKLYDDGECVVFPSKEMRDWCKFDWKKGDVLVNKDGDVYIIFERFADDTYCSFVGKYYLWKENNDTEQFYEKERLLTSDFQKAGKDAVQTYISTIEERLGGKLNRETLEVEKPQPEFKPFDKVLVRNTDTEEWFPGFFEKFDSTWNNPYHIMNRRNMTDFAFKQCIPYIGNESLLGTTNNVEG